MGNEAPGSALSTIEQAEARGDLNILRPVISIDGRPDAQSPYLVETVQVITIVPGVDTYNDFRYANESKGIHALSAIGLSKIAAAAGVKWVPSECRVEERTRRPDGHVYMRYRAAGAIRQPNGEWHLEIATRDIDTADEEEELRATKRRARDSAAEAGNRASDAQKRLARKTDEQINAEVERDVLQIRKFILAHAETKAKNRVIRRILALRQTYTTAELKKPFAVPRLVYRPDVAEANLRLAEHGPAGELAAGDESLPAMGGEAAEGTAQGSQPPTADVGAGGEVDAASSSGEAVEEPSPAPDSENVESAVSAGTLPGDDSAGAEVAGAQEPPTDEPTAAETWQPPPQTNIVGPDRPKIDPTDTVTGRKFSELLSDETGQERLRVIAETSKAPARANAARAWLAFLETRRADA